MAQGRCPLWPAVGDHPHQSPNINPSASKFSVQIRLILTRFFQEATPDFCIAGGWNQCLPYAKRGLSGPRPSFVVSRQARYCPIVLPRRNGSSLPWYLSWWFAAGSRSASLTDPGAPLPL